jgi:MFS family permease
MAFYTEVWMFIVSAAVIGICFSFTTGVCMSDVIDQWFSKSSGLAIGLAWGVNSLCTLLLSPVITLVIEQQGWRTGYIVLAAVSAAMILPASAFIIGSVRPRLT